jgi:dienelactone hydrolase
MRLFCLFLSLGLHAVLVGALSLILTVSPPERVPPTVPVYEVELVELYPKAKDKTTRPKTVSNVPKPNSSPERLKPRQKEIDGLPPPARQAGNRKKIKTVAISEHTKENGDLHLKQGSTFRIRSRNGSISEVTITDNWRTLGMRALAVRTFTEEEYVAHYEISPGRFASIIDGREEYGRLLLFDSKTGMLRPLKRFSRMIYTYSLSNAADSPVQGSVTFLTSKEHTPDVPAPSRILWQDGTRDAYFGTKLYFSEEETVVGNVGEEYSGRLIMPPDQGPHPVVIIFSGKDGGPFCLSRNFGQVLASLGVAAFIPTPRAHESTGANTGNSGTEAKGKDVLAALRFLKTNENIDPARIGLWGRDGGVTAVIRAASLEDSPAFLVISYSDADSEPPPSFRELHSIHIPALWLFTGGDALRNTLRELTAKEGKNFTVFLLPIARGTGTGLEHDVQSKWMTRFSVPCAQQAATWIHALR